jgi:hypothetical protein
MQDRAIVKSFGTPVRRRSRGATLLAAGVFAATGFLLGCTTQRNLAENAVSFNQAVERAQNDVLLLNVVRASERLPMYLTDISKITGSIKMEVDGGISMVEKTRRTFKPTLTGIYALNPTFEVPVMNTQEFMKGFLSPLDLKTLAYYQDTGWPMELLYFLVVRKVVVQLAPEGTGPAPKPISFDNYPDVHDLVFCKLLQFGYWMEHFLATAPKIEQQPKRVNGKEVIETIGPAAATLDQLVEAADQGWKIERKGDEFVLTRAAKEFAFSFDKSLQDLSKFTREADKVCKSHFDDEIADPVAKDVIEKASPVTENLAASAAEGSGVSSPATADQAAPSSQVSRAEQGSQVIKVGGSTVTLYFRSAEAILYYLGELARMETKAKATKMLMLCVGFHSEPIFVARMGTASGAEVSVRHGSLSYWIPDESIKSYQRCTRRGAVQIAAVEDVRGESMHALSLISQLVALNKSAKDFPTTGVIRVIGQ